VTKGKLGHRERIVAAMIAAAARHGYARASVAQVVRGAGVSRATFYEHFADKEDCFLAAFREVVEKVKVAIEPDLVADPPREIIRRLLLGSDRDPAGARLVLIEGLAAGEAARAELEKLFAEVERSIARYLDEQPLDAERIEIPPRALLGAVGSVIAIRVFRGDTGRLGELLDDLMAWIHAYTVPPHTPRLGVAYWDRLGDELFRNADLNYQPDLAVSDRLPRGQAALSPPQAASRQRERILGATARVGREKGYAAMTVADIVATAGVAREAFYALFRSKEDAFLAVQAYGLEASLTLAAAKFFGEGSWPDRVWDAALALTSYVAANPDLATVDFIDSYAVGPAAIRRSHDSRMAYTLFLEDGYRLRPEGAELPHLCSETISGAMLEFFRHEVVKDRVNQSLRTLPAAVYVILAPFTGPLAARELVEAKVAEARGAASIAD
jgi:AcrR family transcriptional regulator